jgi:hypothetical protein
MQEGPTKEVIPEHVVPEKTTFYCYGCDFYDHNLVKSGPNPVYTNSCTHPEIQQTNFFLMRGNLDDNRNERHRIETPEWCPFLKK